MFSLLEYVFDSLTPRRRAEKVLFLGLDGAGKTTLIEALKVSNSERSSPKLSANQPTVGLNVSHTEIRGKSVILLEVGGGESIRSIWHHYYNEATKIIFVVDGSDAARFGDSQRAFTRVLGTSAEMVRRFSKTFVRFFLDTAETIKHLDIQILLVSNKIDVLTPEEAVIVEQSVAGFVPQDEGRTDFCPCSGMDANNLSNLIEWIIR
jgi:GTPase SAR1 family protein